LAQENRILRKINFTGNKHFPDYRLKDEVTIESTYWIKEKIFGKEPIYYNRELYNEDVQRLRIFYQKQGYLNVQIGEPNRVTTKNNKLKLTINGNSRNIDS